jgi:hypothetical protein
MKYVLVKLLFVMALAALTVTAQVDRGSGSGSIGRNISLALPKTLEQTDSIWLRLQTGNLTKGSEIEIWNVEGRFLGVISPFGPASRDPRDTATYIVPIPREALKDGRLELRLIVNGPNNAERAPTKRDVRSLKLKVTSGSAARPRNDR